MRSENLERAEVGLNPHEFITGREVFGKRRTCILVDSLCNSISPLFLQLPYQIYSYLLIARTKGLSRAPGNEASSSQGQFKAQDGERCQRRVINNRPA